MICPVCREHMLVVEFNRIELDVCAECRGVWFDAEELGLLLESIGLGKEDACRPAGRKTGEKVRRCPLCGHKMEKVLLGAGEDVIIDRCARGHGLWFDGGELDTVIRGLRKHSPPGGTADTGGKLGSFLADALFTGAGGNPEGGKGT